MSIVQIKELQKKFDNHTILDINTYTIHAGKGYVFYGYNGCGKTTLLRLIAGLEKPSSGTLDISIPKKERIMCFQTPYMFTGTVEKNLEYGVKLQKLTPDRKRLQTLCERYGIENVLHKNARVLSSGQKQAVALIRALLTNPKLLLLDEPVANLDKNKYDALKEDLISLKKNGGSFVITMHSNQRIVFDIDHCCLLENGNLFNDEKCASRKVR
ncbi:MAG: ATP-binding cassette domain-containing protein, partial [Fibrobacterota bacterium]|nr:ATP-binding cassette domain-containing protein [Chitinispirillaceae bacterium]